MTEFKDYVANETIICRWSSEHTGTGSSGKPRMGTGSSIEFARPSHRGRPRVCKSHRREIWADLPPRLAAVNADIRAHGLRTIPGVNATLLIGYPYNEFYDWDLYFENLYLSYYGVWQYCFTNLREFLDS